MTVEDNKAVVRSFFEEASGQGEYWDSLTTYSPKIVFFIAAI